MEFATASAADQAPPSAEAGTASRRAGREIRRFAPSASAGDDKFGAPTSAFSSPGAMCCRNSASCLAKPRLPRLSAASAGPSSRQCPGHFCTTRKAPASTRESGSDSTQSRTRPKASVRAKRLVSLPPPGSRTSSCTTSPPAGGSAPSSEALRLARSSRLCSRSSASLAAASWARRSASWACNSASVCSLGMTSTVRSVLIKANCCSGSNSRTTSSKVEPSCRIGSQSPSVSVVWPRNVS
mmetsp:Transcript_44474/g.96754  ORF Transcript_44474/g.96754 Transcript_44474/m.96754 type:complete len:240 (-) Transcript_44474:717-1436(-)